MSDGRTVWWAKDALWYDREYAVVLGDEFGAEGTTVIDVLSCQAKLENDSGRVKTGYASLTKKGNIRGGEETTRKIVARAVEIGWLDDFSESRLTFSARVSGWKADQDLARAAVRQERHRQVTAANRQRDRSEPSVTDHYEPSPTEQDRTTQHNNDKNSNVEPRLDEPPPPQPDQASIEQHGQQVSELFAYWQEQCGHPHAKLTNDRRAKIKARLREKYTVEQIRTAIDGARRNAHTNEGTGKPFDDIELICRTGSKLELFIDRATTNGSTSGSSNGYDGDAVDEWAREHFADLFDQHGDEIGLPIYQAVHRLNGLTNVNLDEHSPQIRGFVDSWLERRDSTERAAA